MRFEVKRETLVGAPSNFAVCGLWIVNWTCSRSHDIIRLSLMIVHVHNVRITIDVDVGVRYHVYR